MKKRQKNIEKNIDKPHDTFFKKMMLHSEVSREVLARILPKDLVKQFDLSYLKVLSTVFISDVGKEFRTDMLFKTRLNNKDAYITLLVEHQRTQDPLMPFRILQYQCEAISHDLDRHPNKKEIPFIYPLVIYNGTRPYRHSTDIRDIVAAPRELVDEYFLKPFQLLDLTQIDDSELQEEIWSGVLFMALKHAANTNDIGKIVEIFKMLSILYAKGEKRHSLFVIEYIVNVSNLASSEKLIDILQTELQQPFGEEVMTIAEQLIDKGMQQGLLQGKQEGRQEGIHEGQQKIILKLLQVIDNIEILQNITGLTEQQIRVLQQEEKTD